MCVCVCVCVRWGPTAQVRANFVLLHDITVNTGDIFLKNVFRKKYHGDHPVRQIESDSDSIISEEIGEFFIAHKISTAGKVYLYYLEMKVNNANVSMEIDCGGISTFRSLRELLSDFVSTNATQILQTRKQMECDYNKH